MYALANKIKIRQSNRQFHQIWYYLIQNILQLTLVCCKGLVYSWQSGIVLQISCFFIQFDLVYLPWTTDRGLYFTQILKFGVPMKFNCCPIWFHFEGLLRYISCVFTTVVNSSSDQTKPVLTFSWLWRDEYKSMHVFFSIHCDTRLWKWFVENRIF